jgi:hypothetical protein
LGVIGIGSLVLLGEEILEILQAVLQNSASDIQDQVRDIADQVREEIRSRGNDTERSGESGRIDKQTGAELIRRANKLPKGPLKEALKKAGQRLLNKGKGENHKTQR